MLVRVTALALLGYISAALLAQVIVAIIVTALRREQPSIEPSEAHRISDPAWSGLRAFRVRSRVDEDDAPSQTSFYLEPVDQQPLAPYRAGQFLTFQLGLPDVRGEVRPVTRCCSLSDQHDPQAFRITVKRIRPPRDRPDLPPGLVSSHFHDRVTPGAILQVRAPAGVFVLDDDARFPAVLIASGIGITPLFAMARAALATQPDRALHLFYGVRDGRELEAGDFRPCPLLRTYRAAQRVLRNMSHWWGLQPLHVFQLPPAPARPDPRQARRGRNPEHRELRAMPSQCRREWRGRRRART